MGLASRDLRYGNSTPMRKGLANLLVAVDKKIVWVSEELAAESIRDEITWSKIRLSLGYFILVA
jgi:hypothetical protein